MSLRFLGCGVALGGALALSAPASAQNFRFQLRAEPDVIPADGFHTTTIFVQVPQSSASIVQVQSVRFATTAGSIESQAMLSGGVARVLLRSAATPGTATITAFIGNARETTTVEFSEDTGVRERYLEVAAPYVAYGNGTNIITSAGACSVDFGDLHVESDVRLDVDLVTERLWAQGNTGGVRIRSGHGAKSVELRGDRLFYDLRRRQGVMRRSEGGASDGPTSARQEFGGPKFGPLSPLAPGEAPGGLSASSPRVATPLLAPPQAPTSSQQGRHNLSLPPQPTPSAPTPSAPTTSSPTTSSPASSTPGTDKPAMPVAPATATGTAPQNNSTDVDSPPLTASPEAPDPISGGTASGSSAGPSPTPSDQVVPDSSAIKSGNSAAVASGQAPSSSAVASSAVATPTGPSPVVPGSLAGAPAPLVRGTGEGTRSNPLVAQPKPDSDAGPGLVQAPAYKPIPDGGDPNQRIVELPPPGFDATDGYWVVARRLRVFPRDKVQFERAKIYYNGKKAFSLPLYVLPLDGSFNPTTDIVAFNSRGGIGVNFPLAYQASGRGTGTVYLQNRQGGGFDTQQAGFSLALQQQYWLSSRSHGKFAVDQIGHGGFNVNFSHEQQLDSRTIANFYVNAPRHRDLFARTSVQRTLSQMQVGFEGFFDRPETQVGILRGQFYARMKPKMLGKTGWQYTVSANLLGVSRVAYLDPGTVGGIGGGGIGGGGIGLPGQTGARTRFRGLVGQTLNASFSSPAYSPWRGSTLTANLLATAFNNSDGRRGLAPGVNLAFNQAVGKDGSLSLAYTYDRSSIGLYGATGTSFTHYLTGALNANLTSKIALSAFASRSLSDKSLYGSAGADYLFAPKWRLGFFLDYANFSNGLASSLNTGWSLGRTVGNRELSVNFDSTRRKLYFQYGGLGGLF